MRLKVSTILMLGILSLLTYGGIYNLIKGYNQGDSFLKLAPFIGIIFIIPLYILMWFDRKNKSRPKPPIPFRAQLVVFPFVFALLACMGTFVVTINMTLWDNNIAMNVALIVGIIAGLLSVLIVLLRSKIKKRI